MAPSFWLERLPPQPLRPPLGADRDADVCIVGGGFTGLWTAYELRRAVPGLDVVVLEAHHVGFGASGRNGGWVLGALSGSRAGWRARGGAEGARRMVAAIQGTVGEIAAVVDRESIDCDWRRGGSLTVARTEPICNGCAGTSLPRAPNWGRHWPRGGPGGRGAARRGHHPRGEAGDRHRTPVSSTLRVEPASGPGTRCAPPRAAPPTCRAPTGLCCRSTAP